MDKPESLPETVDWTDRYPSIESAAVNLACKSAIIDGEAIAQDGEGISDFDGLSFAMRWQPEAILLYAFDLMHLDGRDLRRQPLLERRSILKGLVGNDDESRIQFSEEFVGDGAALFAVCGERGIEGIVSKLARSRYRSGRSNAWLKTKCFTESSFVVVGTDRDRKTGALRALLARANETGLDYAGSAFIALDDCARAEFMDVVDRLATPKGLFKTTTRLSEVRWCVPKLTVRVKHLAASKTLRHATVRELVQ